MRIATHRFIAAFSILAAALTLGALSQNVVAQEATSPVENLKQIAQRTSVHIVASGGYYMDRSYPPEIATKSEDQIANELVEDARTQRLGAFGEIGCFLSHYRIWEEALRENLSKVCWRAGRGPP